MKQILFTHSYFLRFDQKQWQMGQPYPPLGTLYAAAIMQRAGYEVTVFDTMFSKSPDEVLAIIQKSKPDIFVIYDDGFNYLTKMCLTNMREAAFRMCKLAKENGCTVLVSSSDSTDRFEEYLHEGADYILLGEADASLHELVEKLDNDEDISTVPGIAFKQNNGVVKTQKRGVIRNLDELPFPAWNLIALEPYREAWMKSSGYFSLNMSTTRGCPFKCNWCAKPIYGNNYNSRSPANAVAELKFLKARFGFDHIWFSDDIFGLKPGWVAEFARLVEQEKLDFKFKIQSRADLLLQDNYVQALARAGCDTVWMGAESGSQKILDAMDKGITVDEIRSATKLLKKHGIKPSFFIQFGYPGETKEDIALTINLINELLPHEIGISVSYPLPGTVFYNRVKEQMAAKTNWTDSNEMALMFQNTYPPAFYKQLHRYVHSNYHKSLARNGLFNILKKPLETKPAAIKKALSLLYYLPATWLEKSKLERAEILS